MSTLNLQVNALSFFDNSPSNNPFLRHFDLTYRLFGISVKNPEQRVYLIPPGASDTIYDGTRSTSIGPTTEFDVTKPYIDQNIYRFTWNGTGPNPAFRTDRNIGITTSTTFTVTVNGPIATFTATAGPFNTTNIQVGDILLIQNGSGASAANQGRFTVLSVGTNFVTIKNLDAVAQTFTIADPNKFLIYSNGGSNNQAQIKDFLLIQGGFSQATWGTYEVVEVTPTWVEIAVGLPAGIPLETNIAPTATNFVLYRSVKKFALIAAQQPVYALFDSQTTHSVLIEPVEPNNPERPGLLLKQGAFYKLVLKNNGLYPAAVIVATAE